MNAKTCLPVVQIMLYFVSRTVDLSSSGIGCVF